MPNVRNIFICRNCGHNSPKWMGKCPGCGEWDTFIEEAVEKPGSRPYEWQGNANKSKPGKRPKRLDEIQQGDLQRFETPDPELNRVLGGGIVPGSLVLIGGEPGIGKSTLMLQVALQMKGKKILYVSGEESEQQIRMRAERISDVNPDFYIFTETATARIFNHAAKLNPAILIIDSIQTMHSALIDSTPGTVSQIRECTGELQRFAKETGTPVFIIGHITKEGIIAGPKLLEHMVDTVLQFEGDRNHQYRIIRTMKNRFGSTAELGIYEMLGSGLRIISNPSELLIQEREESVAGIAIAATIEGLRPMLIEVQALVTRAVYGTPQRSSTGFDSRRLHMLLAVLEKQSGFKFGTQDVFLNIAGGLKVNDPAIDLAIIMALLSSFEDTAIPMLSTYTGEIGLSGEIRQVNRITQRVAEADKLGFEKIFIPKTQLKNLDKSILNIEIIGVERVDEIYKKIF